MNTAENKKILAENILYYMELKGVTKQQLCASLDIKYSTFVEWIKGRAYPRIGAVERLAYYFGCEKSDLIEDRRKKDADDDGLSDSQRALIQFAETVSAEKAPLALRLLQSLVEDNS
jgi:transcriptional regulator with XRE-family HTH domain